MADRRDRQKEALDALCDLSRPEKEAVAKFLHLSRRWNRTNAAFLLNVGLACRAERERKLAEAA